MKTNIVVFLWFRHEHREVTQPLGLLPLIAFDEKKQIPDWLRNFFIQINTVSTVHAVWILKPLLCWFRERYLYSQIPWTFTGTVCKK